MQTAGARILPEAEEQDLNREAVLLQWERKIEQAERRPRRFEREAQPSGEGAEGAGGAAADAAREDVPRIGRAITVTEDATHDAPRRFEQSAPEPEGRRTITITGQPVPGRRRRSVVENQLAQPDRIALWAFLLGLFLVAVAAGTAHA